MIRGLLIPIRTASQFFHLDHIPDRFEGGDLRFRFQERSMAYFADVLGLMIRRAVGPISGTKTPRVVDKTGLSSKYDFTLEFGCGGCVAAARADGSRPAEETADGPNIFVAIEKQLGLKAIKAPDISLEVLVVDHVDRIPTPN
jgi:uncharacterized protein (TIGR03435 family)